MSLLNNEMVGAGLTEHQTRDHDVKCRTTFSFQWIFQVNGPQLGWKTSPMILLKKHKIVRRDFFDLGFIFILYTLGDSHHFLLTTMQLTRISSLRLRVIVRACCIRYKVWVLRYI